jgi:LuxR family transcriptional regulator, regulator of acetate metabolism
MIGARAQEDARQIQRALTQLRSVTGLPLTFGGPVDARQQVHLVEFAGSHRGAMRGVILSAGLGLGGKVAALRRPLVLNDYVTSGRISHHYDRVIQAEDLRAMAAAPVVVKRTVRGVLYGALRCDAPLGDRVVQSVIEAARELEQSLAVHDELTRRFNWLDEQAVTAPTGESASPQWELVRESYAELRTILQNVGDAQLRKRLDAACGKLAAACAASGRPGLISTLSAREVDVLAYVALGWTNAHIAADLGLSAETVKSYLRSAMRKMRCHSRLEAVVAARRHGLLP